MWLQYNHPKLTVVGRAALLVVGLPPDVGPKGVDDLGDLGPLLLHGNVQPSIAIGTSSKSYLALSGKVI